MPLILLLSMFLVSAMSFFLDPAAIDRPLPHLPPYDYFWNAFYFIGALSSVIGLITRRVGFEIAGKTLLVPALLFQLIVAVPILGLHSTVILLAILAVGFGLRIYGLYRGWQETQL